MILFIGHNATLTGAPRFLFNLISDFKKHSDEEFLILLREGGPLISMYSTLGQIHIWDKKERKGILKRIFEKVFQIFYPDNKSQILKIISRAEPRLIFNNTSTNGDIIQRLKSFNAPVISRIPEMGPSLQKYNNNRSVEITLEHSPRLIAVSNAVRRDLENSFGGLVEGKIKVIHGQVPLYKEAAITGSLRSEFGIDPDSKIVGGAGTMQWRKGFDLFVQVCRKMCEKDPSLVFVWIGGNENSNTWVEWNFEVRKLGLEQNLKIVPHVDDPKSLFKSFDVFLMTSRVDPFPLTVLEMSLLEIPTICFKGAGGAEELLGIFDNLICSYGNIEELCSKVSFLLKNENKKNQLVQKLKEEVILKYSFCNDKPSFNRYLTIEKS